MNDSAIKVAGYAVQGIAVVCLAVLVYTGKLSMEAFLGALSGFGIGLFRQPPGQQPPPAV